MCVANVCSLPFVSSKKMTWWLVVQCELAGAVAGHADPHETQQDSHTCRSRALLVLQHSLGCLSLQERAGVTTTSTTHVGMTITNGHDHCQGWWWPMMLPSNVPPGSGCRGILKQVTLVTHLSHPSDGLTVREEPHYNFHFCQVSVHIQPTQTVLCMFEDISEFWANPSHVLKSDNNPIIFLAHHCCAGPVKTIGFRFF